MEDNNQKATPEETVADKQLQEVSGGNSIHKRRLEQLDTHDSSKSNDKNSIHKRRLEQLDTHDSSK